MKICVINLSDVDLYHLFSPMIEPHMIVLHRKLVDERSLAIRPLEDFTRPLAGNQTEDSPCGGHGFYFLVPLPISRYGSLLR